MKKTKQILAYAVIIFLIALYVSALIFAIIGSPTAMILLKIALAMSFAIPLILYGMLLIHKSQKKGNSTSSEE